MAPATEKKALKALLVKFRRDFKGDPDSLFQTVKKITKPKLCTVFANWLAKEPNLPSLGEEIEVIDEIDEDQREHGRHRLQFVVPRGLGG
jgi:hypothetical protein